MFTYIGFSSSIKTGAAGIGTRSVGKILSHKLAGITAMRNQATKQHFTIDKVQHPQPFLVRWKTKINDGDHLRTSYRLLFNKHFITGQSGLEQLYWRKFRTVCRPGKYKPIGKPGRDAVILLTKRPRTYCRNRE